jgi:hemoglobin
MQMRCFRAVRPGLALALLLLTLSPLAGCGPKTGDVKPGGPSLYDKLGGREAIGAVVTDFVESVKSDERIKGKFAGTTDWEGLRTKLTDQICAAAGGPCTYTGKDMKTAHQGMGITEADFNALVDDLKKTLDKFKVGEKEQAELLQALAPMKKDIVNPPVS